MNKNNYIIDEFKLSADTINNLELQLTQEENSAGKKYRACRIKINDNTYFIGFDKLYYVLRKILKK